MQMDLQEWEFLSEDGLIDQLSPRDRRHPCGDASGGRRVISRENLSFYPNSIIDVDYFQSFIDPQNKMGTNDDPTHRIAPNPVQFDHPEIVSPRAPIDDDDSAEVMKEVISSDRGDLLLPKNPPPYYKGVKGSEEETVSQVFFKKMRENEFAEMKSDSPKSTNRRFVPQINLGKPRFDEKEGGGGDGELGPDSAERNGRRTPRAAAVVDGEGGFAGGFKEDFADPGAKEWGNGGGGSSDGGGNVGLSIWRMGMTGIGALCSLGFVACATMCIVVLGGSSSNRVKQQQDQKIHFQIYTDDKRIEPVVHRAAKLNEVISAVRGGAEPLNRAQITIGGLFDKFLITDNEAFNSI